MKQPNTMKGPDVELNSDVKSRELRFAKVPETQIRFPGYSEDETVSGTERKNLPGEVEENVTYRDSLIRLRSAARLGGAEPALGKDGRGRTEAGIERRKRDSGYPRHETGQRRLEKRGEMMSEGGQGQQNQGGQQGGDLLGGVTDQVGQVAGQVQDTAGQAVDQVQDTAGGAVDQVSEVAGGLAPGTQALGDPTTDEEGHTVQRTVDEEGNLVEMVLDEEGNVIDERPAGNAADLPAAEGYEVTTDEQGNTTTTVTDESGTLISLQLGEDGSILDLQIPPPTETTETTEDSSYEYQSGPQEQSEEGQDAVGQVTDQAGQAVQGVQDTAGGAAQQAQDTAGQVADQAGQAAQGAQDTAQGAAQQAQDTAGQATEQAQDAAEGGQGEPNATQSAQRKAQELGVDLSQVEGTGVGGQITIGDVENAANS